MKHKISAASNSSKLLINSEIWYLLAGNDKAVCSSGRRGSRVMDIGGESRVG